MCLAVNEALCGILRAVCALCGSSLFDGTQPRAQTSHREQPGETTAITDNRDAANWFAIVDDCA